MQKINRSRTNEHDARESRTGTTTHATGKIVDDPRDLPTSIEDPGVDPASTRPDRQSPSTVDGGGSAWDTMRSDCFPFSPFKSPAWRYLRAVWLVESGKRATRRIDDDVVRSTRDNLKACRSGLETTRARRSQAAQPFAEALAIYTGPPQRRWLLEAHLLTDEPLESVAMRCALPVATVRAYHDSFFDVRDRPRAHDWIWRQAIRSCGWDGFATDYPGSLWKACAYTAGVLALEVMIAITTDAPFPAWLRDSFTANAAYDERRLRLLGKLTVAALRATTGSELGSLQQARDQLQRIDHKARGTRPETTGMLPVMGAFLRSVDSKRKGKASGSETESQAVATEVGKGQPDLDLILESMKKLSGQS